MFTNPPVTREGRNSLLRLGLGLLLFLAAGCGSESGPTWTHLSNPATSTAWTAPEPGPWTTVSGLPITLAREEGRTWLEVPIPREAWSLVPRTEWLYRAPMHIEGQSISPEQLVGEGIAGPSSVDQDSFFRDREKALSDREYRAFRGEMFLRWIGGEGLPEVSALRVPILDGALNPNGRSWVRGRRFSGEGLFVWPEHAVERAVTIESPGLLRFATCVERLLVGEDAAVQNTFRLLVDGLEVFRHEQARGEWGTYERHAVPLAPGRRVIRFQVSGPIAYTSFQGPVIGPVEIGDYRERPWDTDSTGSADIVLFLADTFRADNLAFYGGSADLTPNLNRFARETLRFRNAWSVGTYTLPAHATLFSGLFPRQTSASDLGDMLPDEIVTITERLRDAGYRTGAITDSAVVSVKFNFNQGFEWFDEHRYDLDSTVDRARDFLEADDGRPVFLFVQTYRTHSPYRTVEVPEERVDGQNKEEGLSIQIARELNELARIEQRTPAQEERMLELRDGREIAYRSGAKGLDQGFARFLSIVGAQGLREHGYLIFTSDHGEAFLEHGQLGHKGRVFEEQIRIPMLMTGPGILARSVETAASLVDLSPTLAHMAGIAPEASWPGTSLLRLAEERPIFAFESTIADVESTITVIERGRKIIGNDSEDGFAEPWAAFDLARDPAEQQNLLAEDEPWPEQLYERNRGVVNLLLQPLVGRQAADLDQSAIDQLKALGYVADE